MCYAAIKTVRNTEKSSLCLRAFACLIRTDSGNILGLLLFFCCKLYIHTILNKYFTFPKIDDTFYCENIFLRNFVTKSKIRRRKLPPHLPDTLFYAQRVFCFTLFIFFAGKGYSCCGCAGKEQNHSHCMAAFYTGVGVGSGRFCGSSGCFVLIAVYK